MLKAIIREVRSNILASFFVFIVLFVDKLLFYFKIVPNFGLVYTNT